MRRPDGRLALRLVDDVARHLDTQTHAAPEPERWACAAGCSYCCHAPVIATPPELARLAAAVLARPDATQIIARVRANAAALEGLHEHALFLSNRPCALLDEHGRCSVYAARPIACRGHVSRSREVCEASDLDPSVEIEPEPEPYMQRARTDAETRLAAALIAAGLDGMGYELNDGLDRALKLGPATWAERGARRHCRTVSARLDFVREIHDALADDE